jgi:hypothetical protein
MAGIVTCKVGAKMSLSANFRRTRQPRRTRRHKPNQLVGGPLDGHLYGSTPGINGTVVIAMRGQVGSYIKSLWSPM